MNNELPAYLAGLNEQQLDAVRCHAQIVYVNAGAGCGKTMLLVAKMVDYIATEISPRKIVALSYTNTAARQIGERFCQQIDKYSVSTAYDLFNGTIHSFCFRMMKSYMDRIGQEFEYTILDDEELREMKEELRLQYSGTVSIEEYKTRLKVISVEDILMLYLRMLDEDVAFQGWMQNQVNFMAIDEVQDLSAANYRILDRLLGLIPDLKLFLVGDPRQNIFEFNGGSYKNLDAFLSGHQYQTRNLTMTYRFGQEIADYVNTFGFTDCKNYPLQSYGKMSASVSVLSAQNEAEEAKRVIDMIGRCDKLTDCAVLSNNLHYFNPLIKALKQAKIPYKVFGGRKLVKRHIRFLNHILRILDNDNPYSISKIAGYAGIDIVQDGKKRKSKFFASELGQLILGIREDCAMLNFAALMNCVIERIMQDPEDDADILRDYANLLEVSSRFQTISDYLMAFASDKETFAVFYRRDYDDCERTSEKGDYLTLSTIHSAKGLEWNHVFVMGLCEGNFPNPFFCQEKPADEQAAFFNNEWKKMYVAATRAKQTLNLSYAVTLSRKGYTFKKSSSRFINNLCQSI